MASTDPHFRLRLPPDLRDYLSEEARLNGRSVNAEIVFRLRKASLATMSEADLVEEQLRALLGESHRAEANYVVAVADRDRINRHIEAVRRQLADLREKERTQSD